jgi:hypothetical protein
MSGPCYENQTDEEREDTLEAIRQNLCVRGSGERPEKPEDIEAY